jgi:DNA-binding transcriptional ArsR family regulator
MFHIGIRKIFATRGMALLFWVAYNRMQARLFRSIGARVSQRAKSMMDIDDVEKNVEVAVNLLKALSNEKRLMVVCALYRGEKNVGELEKIVGLSQSALSQHLARLRRDGLVNNRRHAQTIYYSLSDKATEQVLECLYDIYAPEAPATSPAL